MEQWLMTAFLAAHGLVHLGVWAAPRPAGTPAPFDPGRSWALAAARVAPGPARVASVLLAGAAAAAFGTAAVLLAADNSGWQFIAMCAVIVGLALKVIWYDPWLTAGLLLDLGVLIAVALDWPSGLPG